MGPLEWTNAPNIETGSKKVKRITSNYLPVAFLYLPDGLKSLHLTREGGILAQFSRTSYHSGMSDQLPTILIVDDEVEILRILKKTLEDDYHVLTASRAREAMRLMRSDVAVVLSDQRMPEMTGAELFRHLRQQYPDTVRVVMTGYSDMNALIDSVNQGEIFRYLAKPWEMETLLSTMQQAVERYRRNVEIRRLSDELNRARQELDHTRHELQQLRAAGH